MTLVARQALFISHANPEDNDFTRWLGAKLTARGYEVWADVMSLHGGDDWARKLEEALRTRTLKQLVVCTNEALQKQGVRNELEIGATVAAQIGDSSFAIPLRLRAYDAPFRLAQAQYIRFDNGWAVGLLELLETLESTYRVPRRTGVDTTPWVESQVIGAATLETKPERLITNWLPLKRFPADLKYLESPVGAALEAFQAPEQHEGPVVPYAHGVLLFGGRTASAPRDSESATGREKSVRVGRALKMGWPELGLDVLSARRAIVELANAGLDRMFESRGFRRYQGSGLRPIWWLDIKQAPFRKVQFEWPGYSGLRQVIGQSTKRGVHWHFGLAARVRTSLPARVQVAAHLVFTTNGMDPIQDSARSQRLRVSFTRAWRNPRWRDMQGALLWLLAGGSSSIVVRVGQAEPLVIQLPPMAVRSPFTVHRVGDEPHDAEDPDDPDVDESIEWDDGDTWDEPAQ